MEERLNWRETFGAAWGNLTGVNSEGGRSLLVVRVLFLLIFVGGTAWAVHKFMQAQEWLEEPQPDAIFPSNAAETYQKRLDEMLRQVDVTSKMRVSSTSMAQNMESRSNYPFGDPLLVPEPPDGGEVPPPLIVQPEVIIEYPPEITLKAVMIMGKQHVAVMDISGVGSGMIVKVGDTFMQKKGRIVRIARDKVVVRWGGKNWDIAPSF